MKKLIPIIIVATMIMTVLITVDTGSDATLYGPYVNGQQVTEGMVVDKENEHWRYDQNGLMITGDSVFEGFYKDGNTAYCIYDGGGINLTLNADLLIKAFDDDPAGTTLAIYTPGTITISGTGTLTIDRQVEGRHIAQGLTAGDNVIINGGTINICTNNDITASQVGWGTSFTMNGGEMNLTGSGNIAAENIYIKGGTINVDATCGSIRNSLDAYSIHGDATFEMTGGVINFANIAKDTGVISALGKTAGNLKLHGATGTNWKINENCFVDAVNDGPVTVKVDQSVKHQSKENLDETLVLGLPLGCIALVSLIVLGSVIFVRKK